MTTSKANKVLDHHILRPEDTCTPITRHFSYKEHFKTTGQTKEWNFQLHTSSLITAILAQEQTLYERSDSSIGPCSLECGQSLEPLR